MIRHHERTGVVLLTCCIKEIPGSTRQLAMQLLVDALCEELHKNDISWIWFYFVQADVPDTQRLIFVPHRKYSCVSPIGVHGVYGQAVRSGHTVIVDDVHAVSDSYIACDPRDRAEFVVPLFEDQQCWGVFDVDFFQTVRFTDVDRTGLHSILSAAGIRIDTL